MHLEVERVGRKVDGIDEIQHGGKTSVFLS